MESKPGPSDERGEVLRLLGLLKPYHKLSPWKYYLDISLSAGICWTSIWLISIRQIDGLSVILFVAAYLTAFRGLNFVHEVVHFQKKIPGLNLLYSVAFGYPMGFPPFAHEPHQFHHLPNTFGTAKDPEYLYMEGLGLKYFFLPFISAPLLPIAFVVRFGIYPWISIFVGDTFRQKIYNRFSTLVVNPAYFRDVRSEKELVTARKQEFGCSVFFVIWILLLAFQVITPYFILTLYLLLVACAFMNVYRARVAHLYDNKFEALSPFAQIRDSVTVEGGWLSAFWAPVGLKYHSLHHLAPTIPYHNLASAHKFLASQLPKEHVYRRTVLRYFHEGIWQFLLTLRSERKVKSTN